MSTCVKRRSMSGVGMLIALVAFIAFVTPAIAAPELAKARAPGFKLESVGGAPLDLEALRGRGPVLLDFWATWCKPCLAAIPELQKLHEEYAPRGLTLIGVSTDGPRNFAKVRPFVARQGITYPVALDEDGNMQQKYQVRAMPMTVLIDTSGTIVHVTQGFRPGEGSRLRAAIDKLFPARAEETPAESAPTDTTGTVR